jgi:phosphoglycolate phosphatase
LTAFIFDFDGTLVNSETAIYQCFIEITKQLAPDRIEIAKNILIGPPLRETAAEILGLEHQDKLNQFVDLFIKLHDDEIVLHTHAFETVHKTLSRLHEQNILMAIATNKREAPTIKLIHHLNWIHYFQAIECSDSGNKTRNKDEMIQAILKKYSAFNSSFFVGDTVNDGLSANLNQLNFIKANYGYGQNQDWSKVNTHQEIHQFAEILKLI